MSNSRIFVCSLIICLLLEIEVSAQPPNHPIGNSNDVGIADFPWHATVISTNCYHDSQCGAVIISDRHLLTSAGCLSIGNLSEMHVTIGSKTYEEGSKFRLKSNHTHPKYNKRVSFAHDIAIIEIDGVITFNETQSPIALPDKDVPLPVGASVTVAGWGVREAGSSFNELRKQNLIVVENKLCDAYLTGFLGSNDFCHIEASQLCSLPAEDTPPCTGNRGSGVVLGKTLVGILPQGGPCGKGLYEFVTKVWEHVDWIREVTHIGPSDSSIGSPNVN